MSADRPGAGYDETVRFGIACLALTGFSALLPYSHHYPTEKSTPYEIKVRAVPAENVRPVEKADSRSVYASTRKSVVTVLQIVGGSKRGQGSGSILGRDGLGATYVLTNKHVVYKAAKDGDITYAAVDWAGKQHRAELEFFSRKKDLAILRVPGLTGPPLTIRRDARKSLAVGDSVFSLGTPQGMEQTLTAGIVSALRSDFIQTDATAIGGSSGSPLLDLHGWLAGVLTKSHKVKDYSFAIYGDDVLKLLEEREALKGRAAVPMRSEH